MSPIEVWAGWSLLSSLSRPLSLFLHAESCLLPVSSVCVRDLISSSRQDTCPVGLGSTPMTSF